jgi:hypothetical protein
MSTKLVMPSGGVDAAFFIPVYMQLLNEFGLLTLASVVTLALNTADPLLAGQVGKEPSTRSAHSC